MVQQVYQSAVMYPVGFRQDSVYMTAAYAGYNSDIDYDTADIQRIQAAMSPPDLTSNRSLTASNAAEMWTSQRPQSYIACGHPPQEPSRTAWVSDNIEGIVGGMTQSKIRDLYPAEFFVQSTPTPFDNMGGGACDVNHAAGLQRVNPSVSMSSSRMVASTQCYYNTPKSTSSSSSSTSSNAAALANDENNACGGRYEVMTDAGTNLTAATVVRQTKAPFAWMNKLTVSASTPGKTRTRDKYRLVYTETQKVELEKEYLFSHYISIQRKAELARSIGLSDRQVKIWFQNRRAKERKTKRVKHPSDSPPFPSTPMPILPNSGTPAFPIMNSQQQQQQQRRFKMGPSSVSQSCSMYNGASRHGMTQQP